MLPTSFVPSFKTPALELPDTKCTEVSCRVFLLSFLLQCWIDYLKLILFSKFFLTFFLIASHWALLRPSGIYSIWMVELRMFFATKFKWKEKASPINIKKRVHIVCTQCIFICLFAVVKYFDNTFQCKHFVFEWRHFEKVRTSSYFRSNENCEIAAQQWMNEKIKLKSTSRRCCSQEIWLCRSI